MPCYPHTKFFHHSDRILVVSGPHIQVLDTYGRILHSTTNFAQEDQDAVVQGGPVRCAAMSHDNRYLATTGDDKRLKIWDLDSLTLSSARVLPKKPTSIAFSTTTDILVSDKFGDIFRYPLHPNDTHTQKKRANDLLASHENPSNGELVLGHTSLLTNCLLTPDEKFIITSDRDEHIRVSWYPEGYVIESYCLGHKKFVSAIHIPFASPRSLISGGGDPELKVWDWMTGRLQQDIDVFAVVEPFIKANPKKRRHTLLGEHGDDDDVASSRDDGKRAGKMKRKDDSSVKVEDVGIYTHSEGANNMTACVFVVRRIGSFLYEGEHHIVFSAVGATSIFVFVLVEDGAQPDIRHRDFGNPVIDFTISMDGTIWVLVDAGFTQAEESEDVIDQHPCPLVHAVRWSSGRFVDNIYYSALLDSLNNMCMIPATVADLEALDLYADLSTLPKSVDGEPGTGTTQGPGAEQIPTSTDADPDITMPDATAADATTAVGGPGLTKRALGRLKHKHALDQLRQESRTTEDASESGPDAKKIRADSDREA